MGGLEGIPMAKRSFAKAAFAHLREEALSYPGAFEDFPWGDALYKVRGKIYVMGEVRQQGAVELLFNESLTAGKAILKAGGFGDFAYKEKVKINRPGVKTPIEINMVNVFEKGKQDQDVVLEPDDTVYVPKHSLVY